MIKSGLLRNLSSAGLLVASETYHVVDFFKTWIANIIFISTLFLSSAQLQAQQNYLPKTYSAKDGLPNGYVLDVNQDKEGNLWVGTFSGLSRFDGDSFTNFGFQNGLTNLSIDEIFEERDSARIWLGSRNGLFVLREDTIKKVAVEDSVAITFVFQIIKMNAGQVWALTDKGIYLLDNEHKVKRINIPGLEGQIFRQVVEDGDNTLLVTHGLEQSEIFSVDRKMGVLKIYPTIPNNRFIDIISISEQEIILRTGHGLYKTNKNETAKLFTNELDGKSIYACFSDRHGRLWVSTNADGILIADSANANHFSKKIEVDEPVKMISSFYEGADGTVWAGTPNSLLRINSIDYRIYKQTDYPLLEMVFKILKDQNGKVFLEGKTGLVSWGDNSISQVSIKAKNESQNNLKDALIDAWCYDGANNLWYMSRNGIFGRVVNGNMEEIANKSDENLLHVKLEFDPTRNKMWIPADELLLADARSVSTFRPVNRERILLPTLVVVLNDGDVLVKTVDNKLWKIDSKNRVESIAISKDIDISRIWDFRSDSEGNLWLLYLDGGLLKCRIENNLLLKELEISMKNGLPSNSIESFSFDSQNRIWISTHAGLSVVDWKSTKGNGFPLIYQMDKTLNLPIQNWAFASVLTDNNGNIRLTLVDQVLVFFVKKINFNTKAPSTKFVKVLLDSKANIYDSLKKRIPLR